MKKMQLKVRLFGELSKYLPEGTSGRTVTIELDDGATALDLLTHLGIPHEGGEGVLAIAIGDQVIDPATVLSKGDVVSIFPPLAGGALPVIS